MAFVSYLSRSLAVSSSALAAAVSLQRAAKSSLDSPARENSLSWRLAKISMVRARTSCETRSFSNVDQKVLALMGVGQHEARRPRRRREQVPLVVVDGDGGGRVRLVLVSGCSTASYSSSTTRSAFSSS